MSENSLNPKQKITAVSDLVGDALLNKRDLAGLLRMSPGAVGTALCRGCFPILPLRVGHRLRWRMSDVQIFLADLGDGRPSVR